ncbi:MAG TPA: AraC family transcriptional regulator [Flavisolibacter sp.]|nr:AraC family transcriptional regulator [Flavisolibacter sp.]
MAVYLLNGGRFEIPFTKEVAPVIAYPALAGSVVLSYSTKEFQLLVKELITDLFTIRYNTFRFQKNQAIESVSQKPGIHSRVMLQSDLHFSLESIGNVHQRESTVSMIWSERAHCKALFEKDKEYKTLDIYAAPEMVQQLASFYPELGLQEDREHAKLLLHPPPFMTHEIKKVVTEIMDCPYDETTSRFYFDLKVREYLYVLLEQEVHPKKSRYRFTPYEEQQIHHAREILLSNLNKPPLTIRTLARQVALNEFKLKVGFKHFYHKGVFETFQEARMDRAKELLLNTNKAVKEISSLSGYPRPTNFITAFRKHFGLTPAALRRR